MDVDPLDMKNVLSEQTINKGTKYIWISAEDLYTNLNVEPRGNIDSGDDVTDLLGLTQVNNACQNDESNTSDSSSKPNAYRGTIEQVKLEYKDQFLKTSIGVEATDDDCEKQDEIDLVICLDNSQQIMIEAGNKKYRCRAVKIVESNKVQEPVSLGYEWDASMSKYSSPQSENKVSFTPSPMNDGKDKNTPLSNPNKRKSGEGVSRTLFEGSKKPHVSDLNDQRRNV